MECPTLFLILLTLLVSCTGYTEAPETQLRPSLLVLKCPRLKTNASAWYDRASSATVPNLSS